VEPSAYGASASAGGLEALSLLQLRYPSGHAAHIHVSSPDPSRAQSTLITGGGKALVYSDAAGHTRVTIHDNGHSWTPELPSREPLKVEAQHFADCVLARRRPLSDGANGLNVVATLVAADRSKRVGARACRIDGTDMPSV